MLQAHWSLDSLYKCLPICSFKFPSSAFRSFRPLDGRFFQLLDWRTFLINHLWFLEIICSVWLSSPRSSVSQMALCLGAVFCPTLLSSDGCDHPRISALCSALNPAFTSAQLIHSSLSCLLHQWVYFCCPIYGPALSFRLLECQSWNRAHPSCGSSPSFLRWENWSWGG